ncbi:MAG: ABC transporter permease [Treponema sp.]|jgi:ABC-2 type transport system permease protein|nr:ABC transporter permease [Treponema sp.]
MKIPAERALALARKELYSSFYAPAFYGITAFFLLFLSVWLFYFQQFFTMDAASLRPYFSAFPLAFTMAIPVITMKSWAEERKLGSVELLLTMPFSEWDLVVGKFLAAFCQLAVMLILTIPLPLSLFPLGFFDKGVVIGEYAGVFLLGASATALGLLLSSLCKNQAAAFLGSAVALLFVMLVDLVTKSIELPLQLAEGINFISLSYHFQSFSQGTLDSRDLAFFILTAFLFLFLNTRVILFRKWR